MRAAAFVLSSFVIVSSSLAFEASASACSPPQPGITATYPAKGATTYPANAPIVLQGYGLGELTGLSATVGGKAATVSQLVGASQNKLGSVIALTPAPAPGEPVTLSGNACGGGGQASPSCQLDLSYQAGPADVVAPEAPASVSYDVHDYANFTSSGGDCQSSSDFALWISVPAPAAPPAGEFWLVDVRKASESVALQQQLRVPSTGAMAIRLSASVAGEAAQGGLCVGVRSFDLAGNESSKTETCAPCRVRVDPPKGAAGNGPFSPPEQPAWTSADTFPGGSCAGTAAGGSGGTAGGAAGETSSGGGAGQPSGGGTGGGSAGSSSGLAPVTPASDDGGCALAPRSLFVGEGEGEGEGQRGVAGVILLGGIGLLVARGRRDRPARARARR